MKKKIFSLLAMVMVAMTASAKDVPSYTIAKKQQADITIKVNGEVATTAKQNDVVTVVVTPPEGKYPATVVCRPYATWNVAKTRGSSVPFSENFLAEKVKDAENTYKFTMPASNVEVSVTYIENMDVETKEADNEEKQVDNVTVEIKPAENEAPYIDEETGKTVIPVEVNNILVPVQTDMTELTVVIPVTNTSADGNTVYKVTHITADAFKTADGSNAKVTKVILPDTEETLTMDDGAMKPDGEPIEVITPLAMLDDYSLNPALKENFESQKISAIVTAPNKYWTFSSGVDCILPEGVTAYIAEWDAEAKMPRIIALSEDDLKLSGGQRGIKANNGVLLASEKGGEYEIVACPGNQESGSVVATTDANSYKGNCLTPVIVSKNYPAGKTLILKDNEFHTIKSNLSEVKPCKAVFSLEKAGEK